MTAPPVADPAPIAPRQFQPPPIDIAQPEIMPGPQGLEAFPVLTAQQRLKLFLEKMFQGPQGPLAGAGAGAGAGAAPAGDQTMQRAMAMLSPPAEAPASVRSPSGAPPVNMSLPTMAAIQARMGGPRESITSQIFGG
jgi:hypothetical protein